MKEHFYHMFANGDDAKNFITSEEDFKAAFNRIAVCSVIAKVSVVAASIEDSHPHILLWGTFDACKEFMDKYILHSTRYIVNHRGDSDGVVLHCELYEVSDAQYLANVASYVITQATKDGKSIMPYDYRYGTGALYFRSKTAILPWDADPDRGFHRRERLCEMTIRDQHAVCNTKNSMPGDWYVCNGLIHPSCWVDVKRFESIYQTHNRFRVFLSSSKARDEEIRLCMSETRGVNVEDLEARKLCRDLCMELFGVTSTRTLSTEKRLILAQSLRTRFRLSSRQLSAMTKIPEAEIRKYIR